MFFFNEFFCHAAFTSLWKSECCRWKGGLVPWCEFIPPTTIVVHEFIFNVLRLALEVVPVAYQRSADQPKSRSLLLRAELTWGKAGWEASWGGESEPSDHSGGHCTRVEPRAPEEDAEQTSLPRGSFCLRMGIFSGRTIIGVWSTNKINKLKNRSRFTFTQGGE